MIDPEAPQAGVAAIVGVSFAPANFTVEKAGAFEMHEGALRYNPSFDDFGVAVLPATPETNYELTIDIGAVAADSFVQVSVSDESTNSLVVAVFTHSSTAPENTRLRVTVDLVEVWTGPVTSNIPTQVLPFTNPTGSNSLNLGIGTSVFNGSWAFDDLRIEAV